jgi:hypothetical protein
MVVLMLAYSPMRSFGSFGKCERREGRRPREAAQVAIDAIQKRGRELAVASLSPTASDLHLAHDPCHRGALDLYHRFCDVLIAAYRRVAKIVRLALFGDLV